MPKQFLMTATEASHSRPQVATTDAQAEANYQALIAKVAARQAQKAVQAGQGASK